MKFRIMIVEDEPSLVTMLRYNLEKEGYAVDESYDGEQAVTAIRAGLPDLVLLDWMLPGLSGLEVCRRLRRRPETAHIPVIMITARGEEADKIRGLDTGADDYLTKPFSVPELLARTKALLRRAQPARSRDTLSYGDVVMDLVSLRVERSGQPVHLGPTEFRLLRFLMENPGCVFSREELLNRIWGQDIHVEVRTVDVHIRRLRKALDKGNGVNLIRTVRSAGYALDERE
ncbi:MULTISPECIES: phosphate regulon transcriptional regulator PhoB [unclassified Haematospirillum]|uniref:phosphate regulon transcriptional regulator PhoB n=1 Tax=unclassified Haematospirillum TaxID=2622088 RepID=UPI001439447D|nr:MULTISPECIES: phosphate regulon transcriptional regulator PhoB [unclassified Haematospirillum]NKD55932.1 phosphate regulon transcriptional regulatory protein PhoB [Haematospirillum sp. H4890]NKD75992.1 phosphate regulon transcriptional regulatory protein PhoB [Haematospirillum sp. H4485]